MTRKLYMITDVPEAKLKVGDEVYEYHGPTYGCIGSGMVVSIEKDKTPFMEVPFSSVSYFSASEREGRDK